MAIESRQSVMADLGAPDPAPDDLISHPLLAAAEIHPTPLFEAKDDPAGRRYAVGEGASVASNDQDGEVQVHEPIVLLERRPMTDEEMAAANADGNQSGWGGNNTEGANRSIIGLTAPGRRGYQFNTTGGITISAVAALCCTSLATAQVSGTAASILDQHLASSTFIDAPGALYTVLLLMGDRESWCLLGPCKRTASVDHLWGVGRLRARYISAAGLDAPTTWQRGWTCIDHGEVYDLTLNGGVALPAAMDTLKAAAWWYDVRHETSQTIANVNLGLVTATATLVNDANAYDNKAFVYYANAPTDVVKLRFAGANVSGHNDPSCGANSIRVYYAVFGEDDARDGLSYNTITGEGIYPEYL